MNEIIPHTDLTKKLETFPPLEYDRTPADDTDGLRRLFYEVAVDRNPWVTEMLDHVDAGNTDAVVRGVETLLNTPGTLARSEVAEPLNWHNRVEFDTQAIGKNIRARSAELKSRIDARMAESKRRDEQAKSNRLP